MIIFRIPRTANGKDLREFILNIIKKMRRNMKRKHVGLQGEVAYSKNYVYLVLPSRGLELSFALSILFKCQKHDIPCELYISKQVDIESLPREIIECAEQWSRRKLWRKCYKLKHMHLE